MPDEKGSDEGFAQRLRALETPRFDGFDDAVRLGGGGQAEVFRANGPSGPVAIKRWLDPSLRARARSSREAEALRSLPPHPNIVRGLGTTRDDRGAPCVVLELVSGRVLGDVAREAPLEPARVATIGASLADALAHLHRHGIRHRDVTPQNVIVRPDGTPVLLDLGVAGLADEDLPSAGTFAYAAPEQLGFDGVPVDERADLYGLGATLYFALTGSAPWAPDQGARVRWHHASDAFERPLDPRVRERLERAPGHLLHVLVACLAGDPARRPGSAGAVAAALRDPSSRIAGDLATASRPRSGVLAKALVLTMLGAVALGAAFDLLGRRVSPRLAGVDALVASARAGWRVAPGSAAAVGSWLAEARALLARSDRESLAGDAALASSVATLTELAVRRSRELALLHGPYEDEWRRCRAAVASVPSYANLRLDPVPGLLPLAPNPESGLWEFWHPESGERPERDGTGHWVPDERTAIVFVLVPGGVAPLGDPAGPPEEAPEEVPLAPFFLAKHELTQGQWIRLGHENPSRHAPGREDFVPERPTAERWSLAQPVERVSWLDARAALGARGLTLPTEAQWEWAARGPAARPFPWGDGAPHESRCVWLLHEPWGGLEPRPVGQRPGGASWCGVEDLAGNVAEWCLDFFTDDKRSWGTDPLTGHRLVFEPVAWRRAVRGGNFGTNARELRATRRTEAEPALRDPAIGLRAARRLPPGDEGFDPYEGRRAPPAKRAAVSLGVSSLEFDGAGSPARVGFVGGWPFREDDPPGLLRQLSDLSAPFDVPGCRPWSLGADRFETVASHETGWTVTARVEVLRVEGPTARWAVFLEARDRHAGFVVTLTPDALHAFEDGGDPAEARIVVPGRGPREFSVAVPPGRAGEPREARLTADGRPRGTFRLKPLVRGNADLRFGDGSRGAGGEALFGLVRLTRGG